MAAITQGHPARRVVLAILEFSACLVTGRVVAWAWYWIYDMTADGPLKLIVAVPLLPFEFIGMVLGNVHLGDRRIAEAAFSLGVGLCAFFLLRRYLRARS
jgi:hypothetical protein